MQGKTILGAFSWSFLEQAGSKAVSLVVQIVLARILLPEEFGVLAILLVVVNIADVIAQGGLSMALIQKTDVNNASYTTTFWMSICIAAILFVVLWMMAPLIQEFYSLDNMAIYLRVISVVILLNGFSSIQRSYLQRQMDFRSLFRVSLVATVMSGVMGIGGALSGLGVWALIIQTIAQSVLLCIGLLVAVPWKPSFAFDRAQAKSLFSYGWKLSVTGILNVFYTGISELVIGRACSATDLGYYSQGRKYPSAVIGALTNSIQNVVFPALSLAKQDRQEFMRKMKQMLRLGTFVIAPISFLFAVVAEPIIAIVLTEKWLPCVFIFQMACLASAVIILQITNLRAYMALGYSGLYLKLNIIKCTVGAVVISLTATIFKNVNIVAAVVCVISLFFVVLVDLQPAKRVLGYARFDQIKDLAPTYCICILASAVAYVINFLGWPYAGELALQILSFGAVYMGIASLLRRPELVYSMQLLKRLLD